MQPFFHFANVSLYRAHPRAINVYTARPTQSSFRSRKLFKNRFPLPFPLPAARSPVLWTGAPVEGEEEARSFVDSVEPGQNRFIELLVTDRRSTLCQNVDPHLFLFHSIRRKAYHSELFLRRIALTNSKDYMSA